jgi:hypothetical protein
VSDCIGDGGVDLVADAGPDDDRCHRNGAGHGFALQLMWANVLLAAVNGLPGLPMDGGRLLRSRLAATSHSLGHRVPGRPAVADAQPYADHSEFAKDLAVLAALPSLVTSPTRVGTGGRVGLLPARETFRLQGAQQHLARSASRPSVCAVSIDNMRSDAMRSAYHDARGWHLGSVGNAHGTASDAVPR